jgi:hypothetical protein
MGLIPSSYPIFLNNYLDNNNIELFCNKKEALCGTSVLENPLIFFYNKKDIGAFIHIDTEKSSSHVIYVLPKDCDLIRNVVFYNPKGILNIDVFIRKNNENNKRIMLDINKYNPNDSKIFIFDSQEYFPMLCLENSEIVIDILIDNNYIQNIVDNISYIDIQCGYLSPERRMELRNNTIAIPRHNIVIYKGYTYETFHEYMERIKGNYYNKMTDLINYYINNYIYYYINDTYYLYYNSDNNCLEIENEMRNEMRNEVDYIYDNSDKNCLEMEGNEMENVVDYPMTKGYIDKEDEYLPD